MHNLYFSENEAKADGGAIYFSDFNGKIDNSSFHKNPYKEYREVLSLSNTQQLHKNGRIKRSLFSENSSEKKGGAIYAEPLQGTIKSI